MATAMVLMSIMSSPISGMATSWEITSLPGAAAIMAVCLEGIGGEINDGIVRISVASHGAKEDMKGGIVIYVDNTYQSEK